MYSREKEAALQLLTNCTALYNSIKSAVRAVSAGVARGAQCTVQCTVYTVQYSVQCALYRGGAGPLLASKPAEAGTRGGRNRLLADNTGLSLVLAEWGDKESSGGESGGVSPVWWLKKCERISVLEEIPWTWSSG